MKAPSSQPAYEFASTATPEPVDGFAYFMVPDGSDAFFFNGKRHIAWPGRRVRASRRFRRLGRRFHVARCFPVRTWRPRLR